MSKSIGTRVARLISGNAHALVDRLEDQSVIAVLEQSVRDIEALTGEVGTELGQIAVQKHTTQRQYNTLNNEHEDLSASIDIALRASKDDLVRAGAARQIDIEAQLPILEASLAELSTKEKDLKSYAEGLVAKKVEMQSAIDGLISAPRAGVSSIDVPAASGSLAARVSGVEAAFDRTFARHTGVVLAGASANLNEGSQLRDLGKLSRDNKIEERLAQLKSGTR